MLSFMEFLARSRRMALPDAQTALAMAGIDPHGPHEIDVMRLTKAMKKSVEQTPSETSKATARVFRTTEVKPRKSALDLDARSGKL